MNRRGILRNVVNVGRQVAKPSQWRRALNYVDQNRATLSIGPSASRRWLSVPANRGSLLQHRIPQLSQRRDASNISGDGAVKHTALYDLHVKNGGKMVPFGGFSMPVQYSDLSIIESHHWTREKASLFDVGHMVQHRLSGPAASLLLEHITPSSITTLASYHSTLSCLLHPVTGGIVDDTVITRLGPETFYLVTNAACRAKDLAYLKDQISASSYPEGIDHQVLDNWGLVALQGPLSTEILQDALIKNQATDLEGREEIDLQSLYFGQCKHFILNDPSPSSSSGDGDAAPILISRGGYTGEDGFEISVPPHLTQTFTDFLLANAGPEKLRLAGLGARDSLRLEAGMCLYGHDLNDDITPVQAGLSWIIGKERRVGGGFYGDEAILRELKPVKEGGSGPEKRRIGLIVEGAPAREGAKIVDGEGKEVGVVTSGCPSPTLQKNIAMGYVKSGTHKTGTEVGVVVRGKTRKGVVTKMPFVKSKYWKQAAGTAPG
ncbi:MAG: hypothetical protein Q9218_004538 [Villophora microphyllina]